VEIEIRNSFEASYSMHHHALGFGSSLHFWNKRYIMTDEPSLNK
jgi:hypothetical protein